MYTCYDLLGHVVIDYAILLWHQNHMPTCHSLLALATRGWQHAVVLLPITIQPTICCLWHTCLLQASKQR